MLTSHKIIKKYIQSWYRKCTENEQENTNNFYKCFQIYKKVQYKGKEGHLKWFMLNISRKKM